MLRPIVISAEIGKLNRRKARWSIRKQEIYTWLLNKLSLDIHGYERDGKLEGSCIFTSTVREPATHRDARITAWVGTCDDRIAVVMTSIRFADGDGWRPGGGPRKPKLDNLEIISGSKLRGSGRFWQLEQEYGDDIGAPGPVNRELGTDETAGAKSPARWQMDSISAADVELGAAAGGARSDNDSDNLAGVDIFRLIAQIAIVVKSAMRVLECVSFIRERVVSRRKSMAKMEEMRIALIRVDAVLSEMSEHRETPVRRSIARQKYSFASIVLSLNRVSRASYFQLMRGQSLGAGRSWVEFDQSSVARLSALIGAVDGLALDASLADEIGSELVELVEVLSRLKLAVNHLHPQDWPNQARTHDVDDMTGSDLEMAVPLSIGSSISDGSECSRGIDRCQRSLH